MIHLFNGALILLLGSGLVAAQPAAAPPRDPFRPPPQDVDPTAIPPGTPAPGGASDLDIDSVRLIGIAMWGSHKAALIGRRGSSEALWVREGYALRNGVVRSIRLDGVSLRGSGQAPSGPRRVWKALPQTQNGAVP